MESNGQKVAVQALSKVGTAENPLGSNTDGGGFIDQIEAAWSLHSEPWCFGAGTLIDTPSGLIPIENIQPGDWVYSASHKPRRAIAVSSRLAEETLLLQAHGLDGTIVTPEHPYWTQRRNRKPAPTYPRLKKPPRKFSSPEWVPAGELQRGDLIAFSPPWDGKAVTNPRHTKETAYLLGRWLGDGWADTKNGYYICCSGQESTIVEDALAMAGFEFGISQTRTVPQYLIHGTTRDKSEFFGPAPSTANSKRVPAFVFDWPNDLKREFLLGYQDADGHYLEGQGRYSQQTNSRELAVGIAHIARSLEYPVSLRSYRRDPTGIIEGRIVNQTPIYYKVEWWESAESSQFTFDEEYGWGLVRSVEPIGPEVVYNLQVEVDETFIADGVAVHNCAMYASWCYRTAGVSDSGIIHPATGVMCSNADRLGAWYKPVDGPIPPGAIVILCGIHTEIVITQNEDGSLSCVGGNVNQAVTKTTRQLTGSWRCIVPPAVNEPPPPPILVYGFDDIDFKPKRYGPWHDRASREKAIGTLPAAQRAFVRRFRVKGKNQFAFEILNPHRWKFGSWPDKETRDETMEKYQHTTKHHTRPWNQKVG